MSSLFTLSRRYRQHLATATAFSIAAVGFGLAIPRFVQRLIDDAIAAKEPSLVWPLAAAVLGFGLLQVLTNFLRRFIAGRVSVAIETGLRSQILPRAISSPAGSNASIDQGQILARMTSDVAAASAFIGESFVFLAFFASTVVAVSAMLVLLDALLAALTAVVLLPFGFVAMRLARKMRASASRSREVLGELTAAVTDSLRGMHVLQTLDQDAAFTRVEAVADHLKTVNLEDVRLRSSVLAVFTASPPLTLAGVLAAGGTQVINGDLTVGGLVAVTQYLVMLMLLLRVAGFHLSKSQNAAAAGRRVLEAMRIPEGVEEAPSARALEPIEGSVAFENVTFASSGSAVQALNGVSFTVRRGETVGIVGTGGAGKSALVTLLLRFADPASGRIIIDGTDIRDVTIASLRRHIAAVFEQPTLFGISVRENIALGARSASDEDIRRAASTAAADEFIRTLPQGYDTTLADEGGALSGGQRQRLAIARCLLRRAPIMVLDDPFANLDTETEMAISSKLRPLLRARTTLLITHRTSTLALADRIIVLDQGRVCAVGTHEELIESVAVYRRLVGTAPNPPAHPGAIT